jgi:hypothetical protein
MQVRDRPNEKLFGAIERGEFFMFPDGEDLFLVLGFA